MFPCQGSFFWKNHAFKQTFFRQTNMSITFSALNNQIEEWKKAFFSIISSLDYNVLWYWFNRERGFKGPVSHLNNHFLSLFVPMINQLMFSSLLSMEIYSLCRIIRIHYLGVNLQALNDKLESNEIATRLLNAKKWKNRR